MANAAGRVDPYTNDHFRVIIDSIDHLDFAEVILPESIAEVVEYREGGDKGPTRKLPGTIRYTNLVLRRGVTQSNDLFLWWKNIREGVADRRSISVVLLDDALNEVKRWNLTNVWPCRLAVTPLIACGPASVLIETLECAVERVDIA